MKLKIAIVTPASIIKPELVDGACATLRAWGCEPQEGEHVRGEHGSFGGSYEERLSDLRDAMADPEVDAILCSRGGYGCAHLLDALDADEALWRYPKPVIGFSDVSALHALWRKHGLSSVHSSMAKHLANFGPGDPINRRLFSIMQGEGCQAVEWMLPDAPFAPGRETLPMHADGEAAAPIVGGNLAVTQALIGTPYDPFVPGAIILVEDIAEPIYKVERIFRQLRMAGILRRAAGLIVGRFTEYRPSRDHESMERMLSQFVGDLPQGAPVAFGAPVGHFDGNLPLLLNTPAHFTVADGRARIEWP